jgi:tellurite resistance protein TerC
MHIDFLLAESLSTHVGAHRTLAYAAFVALIIALVTLDLVVFHRKAHEIRLREAVGWSVFWLSLGVAFSMVVYLAYEHHWLDLGREVPRYTTQSERAAMIEAGELPRAIITDTMGGMPAAILYLTGFVIEKSLAMDNLFVIAMVFSFFAVPAKYQHRVLFWGILGALVMRGVMILLGAELIHRYEWVLILFGVFLVLTAVKMALVKGSTDPGRNLLVRGVRKVLPTVTFFDGQKFFTRRSIPPTYSPDPLTGELRQDPAPPDSLRRGWAITPLLLALMLVEITDLVFAVDSIPAIFAITPDPFIVFTSNIFAVLGLRALYFCLAAVIPMFRFLKPALILILGFVGVKLLLHAVPPYLHLWGLSDRPLNGIKVDSVVSLVIVVSILTAATLQSVALPSSALPEKSTGNDEGSRVDGR